MRTINTKPDSYLIQCVEIDLYDLLYKDLAKQLKNPLLEELNDLLMKYKNTNVISKYHIVRCISGEIILDIYAPGKTRLVCLA